MTTHFLTGTEAREQYLYLDDYEEGTWDAVITDGTNDATMHASYTTQRYTKVGRLVYVQGRFEITSKGSMSGQIYLSGLPFTSGNDTDLSGRSLGCLLPSTITLNQGIGAPGLLLVENDTKLALYEIVSGGTTASITDVQFSANSSGHFSLTYST